MAQQLRRPAGILLAAAIALSLIGVPTAPAAATSCHRLTSGNWAGSWASSRSQVAGTFTSTLRVTGSTIAGTISVTGSPVIVAGSITGTINCNDLTVRLTDGAPLTVQAKLTSSASFTGSYQLEIDFGTISGFSIRYVALGDSFASGEANPPWVSGTDTASNSCHRSLAAWPILLSASVNLACSGARTEHIVFRGQTGWPDNTSQVDRLRQLHAQHPIDVITVMIGGNDLGFKATLINCYTTLPPFTFGCLSDVNREKRSIGALVAHMKQTVWPAITNAAPSAQVIAVGYPRLLPRTGTAAHNCFWLTASERTAMNTLQEYLDAELRRAASASGVRYASTLNTTNGRELCTRDSLFHKIVPTCTFVQVCAHPLAGAQRAMAEAVASASGGLLRTGA